MLLSKEGTGAGEQVKGSPRGGKGIWVQMLASGQGRWWELRGLYSVLVNSLFSVMWEAESLAESKDAGGVKSLRREKKKRNNNLKV